MGNLCTRPPSTLEEDLGLAEKKKKKKKPLSTSAAAAMASSSSSLPRSFNRSGSISSSSSPTHRAIRLLGRGAFADTWLFQHLATRRLVAIKLFSRPLRKDQVPAILREVGVQAELGPSCARLVEVFECVLTPTHVGVVMEFGAGGSLTSYVGEKWSTALPGGLVVREELARYLFRQVRRKEEKKI
jgi:serine/threonine protein kinase